MLTITAKLLGAEGHATDCITLKTSDFDHLPTQKQEFLKTEMEYHLKLLGLSYLALINAGHCTGKVEEMNEVLKKSMEVLQKGATKILGLS